MNNGIIFACFVMVGAVFKEYLCIVNFLKLIFRSKICDIIFQVLLPIVLIGLFFITNLILNMGEMRLYTILAFMFGYVLYGLTFYKILDNLHKTIYNKLTKIGGIKYTKLGRFLLK